LDAPNIVWSPHIGGHSPDAIHAMVRKVRANLDAHFAGRPVLSPVPV
jgi:phosphoglycerate dehydrogenase-like enzyme